VYCSLWMKGFKDESSKKNKLLLKKKILSEAFSYHSQGNLVAAEKKYRYFLDQGFNDPRVYTNYAILFKETSREEEALRLLNISISRYPNNPEPLAITSDILRRQGKLFDAKVYIEKAIIIKPNDANFHFNLGIIFIGLKILSKAVIALNKALIINPNFLEAHLNLCSVHISLCDLNEAERCGKKVISLDPNCSKAHFDLSRIYFELGREDEAELSVRKALSINPKYPEAYNNLGLILKSLDKPVEAEISTRKAIELKNDYVEAYYNLSNILRYIGKTEESIECSKIIMKIRPWSIIGSFSLNQNFEIKLSS